MGGMNSYNVNIRPIIKVDIKNANYLKLVADENQEYSGDWWSSWYDETVFANAKLIKEGYNKQIEILDFFNSLDYEIKDSDVILTSELDSVITFFNTTKNERKTLTNYKNIASTNYEHYMSLAAFNNLVYNKNLEWPVLTEEQQKILIRKLNSNRRVA